MSVESFRKSAHTQFRRVKFPTFELVGPPCETPRCRGVLVDTVSLKTQDFYRKCSVCGAEYHRVPARDKIAWVRRSIDRLLTGEQEN